MDRPCDPHAIRKDFPLLSQIIYGKPLVYLDSAATAQKPQSVVDAMSHFYTNQYGTVHRAVYNLSASATFRYSDVRSKVRFFLNAKDDSEIIFTKGTTEGLNLLAYCLGNSLLKEGDAIILSEMEHHANIVPWQQIAKEKKLNLLFIPMDKSGQLNLEIFKTFFKAHKVKLVSIAHIANSTGSKNPIELIIKEAHAQGAKVIIDGAQSAGHIKIDLQQLDADFFLFSGHKIYGPTGIGVLYGKRALLDRMPPYQTGGDMIERVDLHTSSFLPPPMRFEAGTPMIAEVIGLGAAIDYLFKIGLDTINTYETHLTNYALSKLTKIPHLKLLGTAPERGPIINFVIDGTHPMDLGMMLDAKGFALRTGHLCAQPALRKFGYESSIRASFAIYNLTTEIDQLCQALEEISTLLRS